MKPEIQRVFDENRKVYGADKIWLQMQREGFRIARCTVERLMPQLGLRGVIRGRATKTTIPSPDACPLDRVNRQFKAERPNQLWVSDFTYVPTRKGFVYVAFIIDVFARKIVGWKVSRSMSADFVLDALEQAICARQPDAKSNLIHHSDRGVQYASIRYAQRLAKAGIEPSVGSRGDSYDNALAETINGLYKAEVIHRQQQWDDIAAVECATMDWVWWFNHKRLLSPNGNRPPVEAEALYHQRQQNQSANVVT
jgi:transposase InsO family protein